MSGRTVKSRTRLSSHLSVCGGASVHLNIYPERSPILTLTTGDVSVTIAMSTTDLDATAMQFARDLADAAARFAEDCTRFALNANPDTDPAAEPVNPASGLASPSSRGAGRSRGSRAA
ncbi:hypothetical protein [Pseudofrankia sp. DC12]|uniref:hypothetical protein n=1 Tax=Pseudofrankia sp. DC12 TaxID=683315 RepID=UPI0005F786A9|nr:hypothetical protein [Pseudofrankia sp. DC12]